MKPDLLMLCPRRNTSAGYKASITYTLRRNKQALEPNFNIYFFIYYNEVHTTGNDLLGSPIQQTIRAVSPHGTARRAGRLGRNKGDCELHNLISSQIKLKTN